MKTLSKKFLVFLLAICMVTPLLSQPALASDGTSNAGLPEGCIVISKDGMVPFDTDSLDVLESDIMDGEEISPQLDITDRDMGVGVRRITIYPMGLNEENGELFVHPSICKQARYINWTQTQGLRLSNSETLSLMQQMLNLLSTGGDKYSLVGWYLDASVEFDYSRPEYALYRRCGTNIQEKDEPEERREISAAGTQPFNGLFFYPQGIDPLTDYYYVGITGGCYYISELNVHLGALFGTYVSFNSEA